MNSFIGYRRTGALLSAWPWAVELPPSSVAEGNLFWPCDDINLPPAPACDWLSAKVVRVAWSWDSPAGEISGEEDIEAGVRLYRSTIAPIVALTEIGDAVPDWRAMVETRGSVVREEFPGAGELTAPLWSGLFRDGIDALEDDGFFFQLTARIGLAYPNPAIRDGETGWHLRLSAGSGLFAQVRDESSRPVFDESSLGATILGDDGGEVGSQAEGFSMTAEVTERW